VTAEDLALTAARFGAALRGAGVPADPARCERFARAVTVARPATRRELYLCALATLVSGQSQIEILERVFNAMFGGLADPAGSQNDQQAPPLREESPRPTPEDVLAAAARAAKAHEGRPPSAQAPPAQPPPCDGARAMIAPQVGQLGADRAGRPSAQVKRRIEYAEDRCLGFAEAVCVVHGYGVNPQVGIDPRR
jgi:uncharacterized protein with von Willebrand factor type A (vWA) domain